MVDEPGRLLVVLQMPVHEAERPPLVALQRLTLVGVAAKTVILTQQYPPSACPVSNPIRVRCLLRYLFAVDVSECVGRESNFLQRFGYAVAPEATVDEELRRLEDVSRSGLFPRPP